jgi:deoxyribonuclease-4
MSIAGGFDRAVERARQVEATALQVFCKSSNQWRARPLDRTEVEAFRAAASAAGLDRHTLSHCSYLINLASPDEALWARSIAAFRVELERCSALGIPYVVLHPGSHVGSGEDAGLARVARALDRALREPDGIEGVTVLLENTAGQGSNLGHRFEHLAEILRRATSRDRLAVCFDTCHALAAGYEFRDPGSYAAMWREFDRVVGLDRVRGFHLNDSRGDLGSRKDRHEHIGRGHVGLGGFRSLMRDRRFRGRPMVLETPKDDTLDDDRRNLAALRALLD